MESINDADKAVDAQQAQSSKDQRALQLNQNSANSQAECVFFSLPAELRNSIYHMCLVEDDEVAVTVALQPPPLLSTCRQIRSEAFDIWYFENDFAFFITDCDTTLHHRFLNNLVEAKGIDHEPQWNFTVEVDGLNWNNLVNWCSAIHSGELADLEIVQDPSPEMAVIQAATTVARISRSLSWEEVIGQLKVIQVMAGIIDEGWLDGSE